MLGGSRRRSTSGMHHQRESGREWGTLDFIEAVETSSMGGIYPNSQASSFKVDVFVSVSRHSFYSDKTWFLWGVLKRLYLCVATLQESPRYWGKRDLYKSVPEIIINHYDITTNSRCLSLRLSTFKFQIDSTILLLTCNLFPCIMAYLGKWVQSSVRNLKSTNKQISSTQRKDKYEHTHTHMLLNTFHTYIYTQTYICMIIYLTECSHALGKLTDLSDRRVASIVARCGCSPIRISTK